MLYIKSIFMPERHHYIIAVTVFLFYFSLAFFRNAFFGSLYSTTSTKNERIHELILKEYKLQSQQRNDLLEKHVKSGGYGTLYNALVPEVFCKNLIRIGSVGDGGKWACNPVNMLNWPKCTIYSLGLNNDPSFEEHFQQFLKNKCKLRCIDKDYQSLETIQRISKVNGSFKKAFIGAERNKSANIFKFNNILSEFGDNRIDILKIDIEGAEFGIIQEILQFSVPICQILIEIHGKTAQKTFELLKIISKNGFYLFSYEINGFHHELSEYSFIHENCMFLFGVETVYGKILSK